MKNVEEIYQELTIGEKVNLLKMLTAEFAKLVVYETEDDPKAEASAWERNRHNGYEWLRDNRKSKQIICSNCKGTNLLEYFKDIEDYPEASIIKNPLKVTYSCNKCGHWMGKTIWFTAKYPFSTSTQLETVRYNNC